MESIIIVMNSVVPKELPILLLNIDNATTNFEAICLPTPFLLSIVV